MVAKKIVLSFYVLWELIATLQTPWLYRTIIVLKILWKFTEFNDHYAQTYLEFNDSVVKDGESVLLDNFCL